MTLLSPCAPRLAFVSLAAPSAAGPLPVSSGIVPAAVTLASKPVWTRHTSDNTSRGADGVKLGVIWCENPMDAAVAAAPAFFIGGVGGVYFLAEPGELVVEVEKRDRNRRGARTDLCALLMGPDLCLLQEAIIPDDGQPRGSGLGPVQRCRLSASVPVSILYHRLTIDRQGRLFPSYDYWSTFWFYRNDHFGRRRAVLMSPDGGETWKLSETSDLVKPEQSQDSVSLQTGYLEP